jgi:hypothetical protein
MIFRFQSAELLAHCGLRNEILRGGGGEAPGLDDIAEDLQGLDMHLAIVSQAHLHVNMAP